MSKWDDLQDRRTELLEDRRQAASYLSDKTEEFKRQLEDYDDKIRIIDERLRALKKAYSAIKDTPAIKPGLYRGRNNFRQDPDMYDILILVKPPNRDGVQEWCMMTERPLGWDERLKWEYKIGEYLGEA